MIYKYFLIKNILSPYQLNDLHLQIYQFIYNKQKDMKVTLFWLNHFNQFINYLDLNQHIINPILYINQCHTMNNDLEFINYYIYFCVFLYHLNILKQDQINILDNLLSTLIIKDDQIIINKNNYLARTTTYMTCHIMQLEIYDYHINKLYIKKGMLLYNKQFFNLNTKRKRYHDQSYTWRKLLNLIEDDLKDSFYKISFIKQYPLKFESNKFLYQGEWYYQSGGQLFYIDNQQNKIYI
jgi:hypothetical protein